MKKTLALCLPLLLWLGCREPIVTEPADLREAGQVVSETVIDGFGEELAPLTSSQLVRVGGYYDLSGYDSLWISFTATRVSSQLPFDEVWIKIGPAHYVREIVSTTRQQIFCSVNVPEISKSNFCAFQLLTTDSRTQLELSGLRVIGWMIK